MIRPMKIFEENFFSRWSVILWTLAGGSYLYWAKYFQEDTSWIPAFFCAGFVILYGLVVWLKFDKFQRPRLADNSYYIGLIYTLISLAIILEQQGDLPSGAENTAKQVLSGFGIALLTTIAGIVARLFLQEREDTPEMRKAEVESGWADAQFTINETATRLAEEAATLINSFREARKGLEQSINASMDSVQSMQRQASLFDGSMQQLVQTTSGVERSIAGLGDVSATAHEGLAALSRVQPAQVQQVLDQCDRLATAARDAYTSIDQRGQRLTGDLERLFPAVQRLIDSLDKAAEGTAGAAAGLGQSLETNRESVQSLQRLTSSLEGSMQQLVQTSVGVERSVAGLGDAAARAHEGLAALERLQPERIQEAVDQCMSLVSAARDATIDVEQRGKDFADAMEKLLPAVETLTEFLNKAAHEAGKVSWWRRMGGFE